MNDFWVIADRIFDGDSLLEAHALCISQGRVTDIAPAATAPGARLYHISGTLSPGFFDVQVNGGGGMLLNNDPKPETLSKIAAAHRSFGTHFVLPTVISDTPNVLSAAVNATLEHGISEGVAGLHIEGPHLSKKRRGTHDARHLRPFDTDTHDHVARLRARDIPVLITVAPEAITPEDIRALSDLGAVVSLGHSAASFDVTNAALAAGATCFTHLYNAMPPMENRAPGIVGAALASDAYCGIIADGIHVNSNMIMLAHRARPVANRMIAVSDSMSTIGGPDHFTLYGQTIRLQNERLVNAEGSLAGAHLTLATALRNLVSYGVPEVDALQMCWSNPRRMMSLPTGLVGLKQDDLIRLDTDLTVHPFETPPMRSIA